jgi:outer membrane biosynthesis protein TonB
MRIATMLFMISLTVCGLRQSHTQTAADASGQDLSPIELSNLSPDLITQAGSTKPIRVSGGITAGGIVRKAYPHFPAGTNFLHQNSTVVLLVVIGTDGHVKNIDVISGGEMMRQPTVDAVQQWIYRPFQLQGRPVEVETTVTSRVDFNGSGC